MKTLLVLRHAHATDGGSLTPDAERPLSPRGRAEAARVARRLARSEPPPGRILSSAALRARATATAIHDLLPRAGLQLEAELYGADPAAWIARLQALPPEMESAVIVGHNPDLELLVQGLTGSPVGFAPATLAHLELPVDDWRHLRGDGSGRLVEVFSPQG